METADGTLSGFMTYGSKNDKREHIKVRRRRDILCQAMEDNRALFLKRYRVLHNSSLIRCF